MIDLNDPPYLPKRDEWAKAVAALQRVRRLLRKLRKLNDAAQQATLTVDELGKQLAKALSDAKLEDIEGIDEHL